MAKFLYSAAMSLDGFIAGSGGDMSWLADYMGPNPVVDELIPRVGALLVGGRTYGGGWEGPQIVPTRRALPTPHRESRSPSASWARTSRRNAWPWEFSTRFW
jgi:hypothetical protein